MPTKTSDPYSPGRTCRRKVIGPLTSVSSWKGYSNAAALCRRSNVTLPLRLPGLAQRLARGEVELSPVCPCERPFPLISHLHHVIEPVSDLQPHRRERGDVLLTEETIEERELVLAGVLAVEGGPLGSAMRVACRSSEPARWKARIDPTLCRLWSEKLVHTRIGTLIFYMSGVRCPTTHHGADAFSFSCEVRFQTSHLLGEEQPDPCESALDNAPGGEKSRSASVNPSQGQIAFRLAD